MGHPTTWFWTQSCVLWIYSTQIIWFYDEPDTIYKGKLLELNEEGIDFLQSGLISHNQNKNLFLLFNTIISYRIQNVKFFSHFYEKIFFLILSLLSYILLYHTERKKSSFFQYYLQKRRTINTSNFNGLRQDSIITIVCIKKRKKLDFYYGNCYNKPVGFLIKSIPLTAP